MKAKLFVALGCDERSRCKSQKVFHPSRRCSQKKLKWRSSNGQRQRKRSRQEKEQASKGIPSPLTALTDEQNRWSWNVSGSNSVLRAPSGDPALDYLRVFHLPFDKAVIDICRRSIPKYRLRILQTRMCVFFNDVPDLL